MKRFFHPDFSVIFTTSYHLALLMITIVKKEMRQFFSGLLGHITIGIFLLITGIVAFVLPESGILDAG